MISTVAIRRSYLCITAAAALGILTSCSIFEGLGEAATPPNLAWISWRDLTTDEFSDRFAEYRNAGWIIKDVDAYPGGGGLLYSMIWERNVDNRGWAEWRNLSNDQYRARWEQYRDLGYRPTDVEAYQNGSLYAGIWEENVEGYGWYSYRGLTSAGFQDHLDEKSDLGYRLVDFEAYETGAGIRYAGIWYENEIGLDWAVRRDLTRDAYQAAIDSFDQQGYRVIDFESYTVNGQQRYAAIWEQNLWSHAYAVRSNRVEVRYANFWRLYRDQGMRIIDFERYETPSGPRYAGVWTENSPRYRWDKKGEIDAIVQNYRGSGDLPGLSVAIVHSGDLVYQRGFGMAEIDRDKEAHGRSVYLAASISKVIGGTLAAKLESDGALEDGTPVTFDPALTTTSFIPIPAPGHTHTVNQLLSHMGCIWHYNGGRPSGHFDTARDAVEEMWDDSPMGDCTIGTAPARYSTHAFTFIGAVLEAVTGRSIARLVEEEIADPNGLRSMRAQYRTSNLPGNYERAAPYNDGGGETSYGNNSWKVLGGGIEVDAVDLAWFGWRTLNGQIVDATTRDSRLWMQAAPGLTHGMAWELRTIGTRRVAEHGGSWSGALSHLRVYRDDELVIAILSNQRGHAPSALATLIGDAVLD